MAIDPTVPVYPPMALAYGNVVTVQTADTIHKIEVWRAPDNGSGGPNDAAAVVCATLPPAPRGGVVFADSLPNDGAPRYYKSRHVDEVGNTSTFTTYSDGLVPVLLTNTLSVGPMAAFGAIVDALSGTKYELRFASTYLDPDGLEGLQSYIDFPATTNFMRVGQTPLAIAGSTNANPSVVNVTAHGYTTGDVVTIRGHAVNTAINGTWAVTVVDANHFSVPAAGVGVGGATGHVVRLSLTVDASGNLTSYGALQTRVLKVFDQNNAVILDVESGKRILAVPVQDLGQVGTDFNIDLSTGLSQKFMLANSGLNVGYSNPTPGQRTRVIIQQDATGSRTLSSFWENNVQWPNDAFPTLSTGIGAMDIFELEYLGTPARFTGAIIAQNVSPLTPLIRTTADAPFATAATSHICNITSGGGFPWKGGVDTLVAAVAVSAGTITTPAGWTLLASTGFGGGGGGIGVYALPPSNATTVNFVTSVNAEAAIRFWAVYRCGTVATFIAQAATGGGASANPDPPSVTPAALDRHLFLAIIGTSGAPTISAFPTNYGSGQQRIISGGGNALLGVCYRNLFTGSAENPAAYTISAAQTWGGVTVAIPPTM